MKPMNVFLLAVTVMLTVVVIWGMTALHRTATRIETHQGDLAQVMAEIH